MVLGIQLLKARDFLDRARLSLHRRSYWQSLAQSHPINGLTLENLQEEIARSFGHVSEAGALVPLPGLTFRRGQGYYHGHGIGPVSPALIKAYKELQGEGAVADPTGLIAAGLAFQTVERSPIKSWELILSPHLDDAALSLGGLIHGKNAGPTQVLVCNVFTVCRWLGDGFRQSSMPAVSLLRSAEEALCNQILGSVSVGLDLWDAEIRNYHRRAVDNYPTREGFVFADDDELRTPGEQDTMRLSTLRIAQALQPTRVYFPLGLGSHLDHRHLRDLGQSLSSELRASHQECAVYFYEDQPYATYEDSDAEAAAASLGALGTLVPEIIDVTSSFEAKIQAVAAHRSQFRREENEGRLRQHAHSLARSAGLPEGHLAERIWRVEEA